MGPGDSGELRFNSCFNYLIFLILQLVNAKENLKWVRFLMVMGLKHNQNGGILGFSHFVDIVVNFKLELFRKPDC